MPTLNDRINATTERLLKLERQRAIKEYAAKERERKAKRKEEADARKADAHRKIELGGLVIAAGSDGWNPAEVVGALLMVGQRLTGPDGEALRTQLRERGIAHLEAREAERKSRRQ